MHFDPARRIEPDVRAGMEGRRECESAFSPPVKTVHRKISRVWSRTRGRVATCVYFERRDNALHEGYGVKGTQGKSIKSRQTNSPRTQYTYSCSKCQFRRTTYSYVGGGHTRHSEYIDTQSVRPCFDRNNGDCRSNAMSSCTPYVFVEAVDD